MRNCLRTVLAKNIPLFFLSWLNFLLVGHLWIGWFMWFLFSKSTVFYFILVCRLCHKRHTEICKNLESNQSITPKYARNLLKVINHNLQKTTCAKLAKWEYVCLSKHCWCSPEKIDIFHLRFFHTKNSNCINT